MRKIFLCLLALMLAAPFTANAMTAPELAAKLQAAYDKTTDMKASFTQVSEVKAMLMKKESSGTLIIKKPGLLRYTYKKPEKQEFIVRGEDMIMYMPEQNQVVTKKLVRAFMDKTPSTFLAGLGRITDSFNVSIPRSGGTDKKGNLLLTLTPRGDSMGVKEIGMTLDPATYDILGYSFTDVNGNTNVTTLSGIKKNTGLSDGLFDFKIPKGASVMAQ
ncbi:MAG: outer membrane lipoprotein chaperone LolA [Nitrospirae bacterium]|nr:outer membrane lipoprotein chaperone LolA [Nitrospirota bacterium]